MMAVPVNVAMMMTVAVPANTGTVPVVIVTVPMVIMTVFVLMVLEMAAGIPVGWGGLVVPAAWMSAGVVMFVASVAHGNASSPFPVSRIQHMNNCSYIK
jgi:hypothetical protein